MFILQGRGIQTHLSGRTHEHAHPFFYCFSPGPIIVDVGEVRPWRLIRNALDAGFFVSLDSRELQSIIGIQRYPHLGSPSLARFQQG